MNLVSNDVERFLITSLFLSYLFWAPLQAIAIFFVGLEVIGFSFAAGFGLLVLVFGIDPLFTLDEGGSGRNGRKCDRMW